MNDLNDMQKQIKDAKKRALVIGAVVGLGLGFILGNVFPIPKQKSIMDM